MKKKIVTPSPRHTDIKIKFPEAVIVTPKKELSKIIEEPTIVEETKQTLRPAKPKPSLMIDIPPGEELYNIKPSPPEIPQAPEIKELPFKPPYSFAELRAKKAQLRIEKLRLENNFKGLVPKPPSESVRALV